MAPRPQLVSTKELQERVRHYGIPANVSFTPAGTATGGVDGRGVPGGTVGMLEIGMPSTKSFGEFAV